MKKEMSNTKDTLIQAYQESKKALNNQKNQETYYNLKSVVNLLNQYFIQNYESPLKERIALELENNLLFSLQKTEDYQIDDIRKLIIDLANLAEKFREMPEIDQVQDQELIDLLELLDISVKIITTPPISRSYMLTEQALSLSKTIFDQNQNLQNLDFYAVTLTKHLGYLVQVHPEEWKEANRSLLDVANFLYDQTNNPKYLTMLAGAQFAQSILNKKDSDDEDN